MTKKYQVLTGMHDLTDPEIKKWQLIEKTAREIFRNYSYEEIRTPLLESTELFVRGIGEDTGVVSKEMYSFLDKGEDSVTLRPEGTASVVRSVINQNLFRHKPQSKLFYMGPMFRYERPQKGRLRQFHQIGCEVFGSSSAYADIEAIAVADQLFKKLKIKNYQLKINSLGLIEERKKYLEELKKYLKPHQDLMDEDDQKRLLKNPLRVLDSKNEKLQEILNQAPKLLDHLSEDSKIHWQEVLKGLDELGIKYEIDTRIVRGLDYYVRTAFEFTSNDLGSQSAFAGGGRYDGLIEELGGPKSSAVGFAIGMERLVMLLDDNLSLDSSPIYLAYSGDSIKLEAFKLCQKLRDQNHEIHFSLDDKSLKAQLKQADKFGCSKVLILGEQELQKDSITIKDLKTGKQEEVLVSDLEDKLTL